MAPYLNPEPWLCLNDVNVWVTRLALNALKGGDSRPEILIATVLLNNPKSGAEFEIPTRSLLQVVVLYYRPSKMTTIPARLATLTRTSHNAPDARRRLLKLYRDWYRSVRGYLVPTITISPWPDIYPNRPPKFALYTH